MNGNLLFRHQSLYPQIFTHVCRTSGRTPVDQDDERMPSTQSFDHLHPPLSRGDPLERPPWRIAVGNLWMLFSQSTETGAVNLGRLCGTRSTPLGQSPCCAQILRFPFHQRAQAQPPGTFFINSLWSHQQRTSCHRNLCGWAARSTEMLQRARNPP